MQFSQNSQPLEVVARTCWGEARNQGFLGMLAVGFVILNRATHPRWWGDSLVSVCLDPWQFSSWNENDPNRERLINVTNADPQYRIAKRAGSLIVSGSPGEDITLGADSYYATGIAPPEWATRSRFTIQIGAHRFYRVELPADSGHPDAPPVSAETLNAQELRAISH